MLIKLIPVAPQPTVLFSFVFQNLEDTGVDNIPSGWETQLSALNRDGLELPKNLHALDKAAGIPALIEDVVFSVPALTVVCRYQDGAVEEWPLMEQSCLDTLDNVIADVMESAVEMRREKEREDAGKETTSDRAREKRRERTVGNKKQMSLINSLLSSTAHNTHATFEMALASPGPSATRFPESSRESMSSRALRRRARSTLVDAFRRYVLPELSRRFRKEGYCVWVIDSMIKRAQLRMDELVQLGYGLPDLIASPSRVQHSPSVKGSAEESDDDETDTDASSIRTPSATDIFPSPPGQYQQSSLSSPSTYYFDYYSRTSTKTLSPQELAEYSAFSALTRRLRKLMATAQTDHEHMENERRHQYDVLEVRSRRRAYINGGFARHGGPSVALSTPYKSSRLAQQTWSGEDFEYAPLREDDKEDESFLRAMGLAASDDVPRPPSRLFVPYDSDEEEEDGCSTDIQRGLELLGLATPSTSWKSLLHEEPAEPPMYSEDDPHLPNPYDDMDKDMSAIVRNVYIAGDGEEWSGDSPVPAF
ncbi:hypothetical protein BD626DRAFT_405151 [Schizophyllum amplum]|uniref:Uncharacterized protein n=1 Tax=Schizophyllum amplum TaxID=97359 RepID=A0A550CAN8_9AGAR|nr:hypothetical protein BD626DRAFT_405151 [Auriculariopsis ampla]